MEPVTLLNRKVLDYLGCPNCGAPRLRYVGKCCNGACRVALHRWRKAQPYTVSQYIERESEARAQVRDEVKRRRPVVRIGRRSTLALRSPNLPHGDFIEEV